VQRSWNSPLSVHGMLYPLMASPEEVRRGILNPHPSVFSKCDVRVLIDRHKIVNVIAQGKEFSICCKCQRTVDDRNVA